MQQLPSNMPETAMEKILRWLPFIAAGVAIFWFWGGISAFVVETLKNTVMTIVYGVPLAALVLYVWSNPAFIWMSYKNICKKITSFFIKMDPLSYMDRYADILSEKLTNVRKSEVNLKAQQVKLKRQIDTDQKLMNDSLKMGEAAMKQGNKSQASLYGLRAKGAQESINLFTPNLQRLDRSIKFLQLLDENWDTSIISMRETIERKRTEWQILKENAKALNQASEFLRGDTEEGKIFQESMKALEDQVSQKIAYIEDFEQRAKPIMEGAQIEKSANQADGLDMLEQYMNDSRILLPDFSKIATPIEYETVPNKFNI